MRNFKLLLMVAAMTTAVCANPIYAMENESPWGQSGTQCNWAPYVSDQSLVATSTNCAIKTEFSFTQSSLYQYDGTSYYFTLEHNSALHPVTVADQYTDLPNPTYGSEDDLFDGDNYIEESEISANPEDIEAFKTYCAVTMSDLTDVSITSGAYDTIAQVSRAGSLNEVASDFLSSDTWSKSRSSSPVSKNSIAEREVDNTELKREIKKLFSFTNKSGLETYKNQITDEYLALKGNTSTYNINSATGTNNVCKAVVTFNEPVTLAYLNSIIQENNCELVKYEARFYDSENDWITLSSSRRTDAELAEMRDIIAEDLNDDAVYFDGITSVILNISLMDNTYDNLTADEKIYLVDMSEYLLRKEYNDSSLKVTVSDCYYYLEKYE